MRDSPQPQAPPSGKSGAARHDLTVEPDDEPSPARPAVTWAVVLALVAVVAMVLPSWWAQVRAPPPFPVPAERVAQAREALAQLRIVEPLPLEAYEREFFGEAWFDVDHNGCDTRNDVLATWLHEVARDPLRPCLVVSGTLLDPYSGHLIEFLRGPETSGAVQIDHVVALADAWRKGAATWTADVALAFANDPANLIAVDGQLNQDKGADDAGSWLPPNAGFRCAYVVQQILVKSAYGLGVTSEEFGALGQELGRCPHGASGAMSVGRDSVAASGWSTRFVAQSFLEESPCSCSTTLWFTALAISPPRWDASLLCCAVSTRSSAVCPGSRSPPI